MKSVLSRINRRAMHFRLHPIRVFLFHQVGEVWDPSICNACDWTHIDQFKKNIIELKKRYSFISLSQAMIHCSSDFLRLKRFAVLTSDDGAASLKTVLPWLKEQGVPICLFINGKYLDGVSFRDKPTEQYLNERELFSLLYDGIEVAHHGWEHSDITGMDWQQFVESVEKNTLLLKKHPRYIPFWAYTWGRHTDELDSYLRSLGIKPVLIDGMKNYCDEGVVHRELLDGKDIVTLGV